MFIESAADWVSFQWSKRMAGIVLVVQPFLMERCFLKCVGSGQVPFAGHCRIVTGLFECLGYGYSAAA